jgi:hypothetical protein
MSDEDLLATVTWHFLVGNEFIDGTQYREHKRRGACSACDGESWRAQRFATSEPDRYAEARALISSAEGNGS